MPIIAVCPYCREGKVRAPDRAVGMTFPCPRCRSSFTLTPSAEPTEPPPAKKTAPIAAAETETNTYAVAPADPPAPQPEANAPGSPLPAPPPPVGYAAVSETPDAPDEPADPGLPWALVGLSLAGVGLAASQFPFGRFVLTGLAAAGLVVGLLAVLAAERKRLLPAAACVVSTLGLMFAVLFPDFLGLDPWRPPVVEDDSNVVKSVGHDGELPTPAEWVDAARASWQLDDVRVTVLSASVVPFELAGPGGQRKPSKEKVLQITLRVANVGVARKFEFLGWSAAAPDATRPRLTDAAGKGVPAKRFETGWGPAAPSGTLGSIFPGKTADYALLFEPPAGPPGELRLELPAAAFGGETPVKLLLPASFVGQFAPVTR